MLGWHPGNTLYAPTYFHHNIRNIRSDIRNIRNDIRNVYNIRNT